MTFAMDDLGLSLGIDKARKAKLIEETRKVEKSTDSNASGSVKEEPEVKDVFETVPQKAILVKNSADSLQENYTAGDIVKEGLNKISASVEDIKKIIESGASADDSRKKIVENYQQIKQIAKETSFNDKQLIKEPESKTENNSENRQVTVSLEEMKITDIQKLEVDTKTQKDESVKKLDEIMDKIKTKEAEYTREQDILDNKINSLVELKVAYESEKKEEIPAEKLKTKAVESIKENPEKSIQVQIKNIDRNLLLAMISLRMA